MSRYRAGVVLPFLLLYGCTFLGLDDEPEPVSSPAPQPVVAPVARAIDPNTGVLTIDDLGPGWKVEPPDPEESAGAEELADDTNDCGQQSNIPDPQTESRVASFSNEGRFTFLLSEVAQFPKGQGGAFLTAVEEDARRCPKSTQGNETFYIWSITTPALGDEALRFRLVFNEVKAPPLWADAILIRRGDAVAVVYYGVVAHEIDPDFSNSIAQRADARLRGATTAA